MLSEHILIFFFVCPFRRNLEFFDSCHNAKVRSCDTDCTANAGELIVKIPRDVYSTIGWGERGEGRGGGGGRGREVRGGAWWGRVGWSRVGWGWQVRERGAREEGGKEWERESEQASGRASEWVRGRRRLRW